MDESHPPQDMRHFDDAAWAANFYEAITEGVRIGPRCTAWDTVAGYGPWGSGSRTSRSSSISGTASTTPGSGNRASTSGPLAFPGARVTIFEDSGHFAVVDHWGEMLSAVIEDFR